MLRGREGEFIIVKPETSGGWKKKGRQLNGLTRRLKIALDLLLVVVGQEEMEGELKSS